MWLCVKTALHKWPHVSLTQIMKMEPWSDNFLENSLVTICSLQLSSNRSFSIHFYQIYNLLWSLQIWSEKTWFCFFKTDLKIIWSVLHVGQKKIWFGPLLPVMLTKLMYMLQIMYTFLKSFLNAYNTVFKNILKVFFIPSRQPWVFCYSWKWTFWLHTFLSKLDSERSALHCPVMIK